MTTSPSALTGVRPQDAAFAEEPGASGRVGHPGDTRGGAGVRPPERGQVPWQELELLAVGPPPTVGCF